MPPKMKLSAEVFSLRQIFVVIANCTSILKPIMCLYPLCSYYRMSKSINILTGFFLLSCLLSNNKTAADAAAKLEIIGGNFLPPSIYPNCKACVCACVASDGQVYRFILIHRPPATRIQEKVFIPQDDHPHVNFIGLLIGPR